ncbi:hypothetical protein JKP88DRAFT_264890 [Tribonema minus]|uniref:GCK domain-containing protein n=1 Tax=Tribonema minus TaxID=303371 RepID=A0A836CA27_9STRA|nr:hypothetical protein JKP88DRAFT_264890 [Tribonema minus]
MGHGRHQHGPVAVHLDEESLKRLTTRFPKVDVERLSRIYLQPKGRHERRDLEKALGAEAQVTILGLATSAEGSALVAAARINGAAAPLRCGCPHVAAGANAEASERLVAALRARGVLDPHTRSWSGVIKTHAGARPVFARYLALEPLPLTGRICPEECYDAATGACPPWYEPPEGEGGEGGRCVLCELFERSACAGVYGEWSACMRRCVREELSVYATCLEVMLALRDCTEAHPEIVAEYVGDDEGGAAGGDGSAQDEDEVLDEVLIMAEADI